jgi:hypothetical protein
MEKSIIESFSKTCPEACPEPVERFERVPLQHGEDVVVTMIWNAFT